MHNNALHGIPIISASGDIASGTITITTGSSSSTSDIIQTLQGTVSSKNGLCQNLACTGMKTVTIPESRWIFIGLDANPAREIEMCRHLSIH